MALQMLPRVILLDAGGVLLRPSGARIRARLSGFGIAPPSDEACQSAYAQYAGALRSAPLNWTHAYDTFLLGLGVPQRLRPSLRRRAVLGELLEPVDAIPTAREAMTALADLGLRMVIVSNGSGITEHLLREHQLCSVDGQAGVRVAGVVDSEDVGFAKPDRRIFELALATAGEEASDALMVGDTVYFDVRPAQQLGLDAVHISDADACGDPTHHHAADLLTLAAAVGGGGVPSLV